MASSGYEVKTWGLFTIRFDYIQKKIDVIGVAAAGIEKAEKRGLEKDAQRKFKIGSRGRNVQYKREVCKL